MKKLFLLIIFFLSITCFSFASDITYSTKVENSGATSAGRLSAADANEIKTAVNSKLDSDENAVTASALAADGANCSAGSYPLGVDASGAVESCTDATTEINSAIGTHSSATTSVHGISDTSALLPSIDQDDMSSDSESYVPTQQSVKAYVDGQNHVIYQADCSTISAGQICVDSDNGYVYRHNGTAVVLVDTGIKTWQFSFDPGAFYASDHQIWLADLIADTYPAGIVITKWYADCNVADPDVEIDLDLKYCDAVAGGNFTGANSVVVDVMDTTTGNSSETNMSNSDLGSGVIPTGKTLYLNFGADPEGTCTQLHVKFLYYLPES